MKNKNIYIICPVRKADEETKEKLENYTKRLEKRGHNVYLPHRDTDQNQSGFQICRDNVQAIKNADEVHIFYMKESTGSHFDLGATFVYNKPIKVIHNKDFNPHEKSFAKMIEEWEEKSFFV